MAEFSDIVERFNAGQTDLKNETTFIFKTQGEAAAYDFARAIDEAIGNGPYNLVISHVDKLKADAAKPQFNEAAAAAGEMYKQKIQREKLIKQNLEKMQMKDLTNGRAEDLAEIVNKNNQPILTGPRLGGKGGPGGGPDAQLKQDGGYRPISEGSENNMFLYVLLLVAAVGLLYSLSKK